MPRKGQPTVGVPRALTFYKQAAMCVEFFTSLGARVVLSGSTNRETVEDGIELSVDESCLPVKIFIGHVKQLIRQQPDFIFVCRQQDFSEHEVLCTKLWGLPDICRNTFTLPEGCQWLELNVSQSVDRISELRAWCRAGRILTRNRARIRASYRRAALAQKRYEAWLLAGETPMQALKLALSGAMPDAEGEHSTEACHAAGRQLRIALVGHSYLVHDEHLGQPLIKLLRKLGAEVHLVEQLDKHLCRSCGKEISPHLDWTYNREIVGAAELYLRQGVDGVIFVESFPCGPDALALDLATRKIRGRAPIMRLVIDEQQGLAGVQTRFESFVDVLHMRSKEDPDG